jgi:IrrE N-terminal-like domain
LPIGSNCLSANCDADRKVAARLSEPSLKLRSISEPTRNWMPTPPRPLLTLCKSSMQHTPNNLAQSKFPPNPKQWKPERNGHALRERFGKPLHVPLDPFDIVGRYDGVELIGRRRLEEVVGPANVRELFGQSRRKWSGFVVPVAGVHLIVINDTHAPTRQNATLTEELFHIMLGHKPSKIFCCPQTGLLQREYTKEIEHDAYWSAAAALVPYAKLKEMFGSGGTIEAIAEFFNVSIQLVEFRLKVTKLWRQRN